MIYISGYYANAMRRATSITPTPAAHAKYPGGNLGYGMPSHPFKFGSVAADVEVVADINFLLDPGLEEWLGTTLVYWTEGIGAGTYSREGTIVDEGLYSLKLTGVKSIYQDVTVLPGKDYEFLAALYGDGTRTANVWIQDLDTYYYLNSSLDWQFGATTVLQRSTASWGDVSAAFTVASATNGPTNKKLRIYLTSGTGSTGVYFDDLALFPTVDFTSVHGHNIPTGAAVTIEASSDDSTYDQQGILTMAQPAFYKQLAHEEAFRYWKLLIASQAIGDPIWIGEWALGSLNILGEAMRWGWEIVHHQPRTDVRMATTGQLLTRREAYRPSRDLVMDFIAGTEADRDEMLESVIQASEQADEPVIMVPDTSEPVVIHGRVSKNTTPVKYDPGPTWGYSVTIEEDAYPVAGF